MIASRKPPLIYLTDEQLGVQRIRKGRGFTYKAISGERITDSQMLKRIKSLAIPPAWTQVWICPKENGYLQATGRDSKHRKQYIYHEKWRAYRQAQKFDHMIKFAHMLPRIRKTSDRHLMDKKWSKRKVLALIVKILDETAIRIGNQNYADQNGTYGLTTLRRKHLEITEDGLLLSYKGKSKQYREVNIEDKKLIRLVKTCSELPGYEIFRYKDSDGKFQPIDSQDVNEYLQVITEEELSSKDFRTWLATASAVELWPNFKKQYANTPAQELIPALVKLVAKKLGNTSAVCKKYYIHPLILETISDGKLPEIKKTKKLFNRELQEYLDDAELLSLYLIR